MMVFRLETKTREAKRKEKETKKTLGRKKQREAESICEATR
jgi:hypothetical protein